MLIPAEYTKSQSPRKKSNLTRFRMIDFLNSSINYLDPADDVGPFWPGSVRQALFRPFSFPAKVEFLHMPFNTVGYHLQDFRRGLQTHWHLNSHPFRPFHPLLRLCERLVL